MISVGSHEGDYVNDEYLSSFLGSGDTDFNHPEETCTKLMDKLRQMLLNSGVSFKNSKWDRIVLATDPVRLLFVKESNG